MYKVRCWRWWFGNEIPIAFSAKLPPHGGLQPFHQKSTCLRTIKFRAVCNANLVTQRPPKRAHGVPRRWPFSPTSLRTGVPRSKENATLGKLISAQVSCSSPASQSPQTPLLFPLSRSSLWATEIETRLGSTNASRAFLVVAFIAPKALDE